MATQQALLSQLREQQQLQMQQQQQQQQQFMQMMQVMLNSQQAQSQTITEPFLERDNSFGAASIAVIKDILCILAFEQSFLFFFSVILLYSDDNAFYTADRFCPILTMISCERPNCLCRITRVLQMYLKDNTSNTVLL